MHAVHPVLRQAVSGIKVCPRSAIGVKDTFLRRQPDALVRRLREIVAHEVLQTRNLTSVGGEILAVEADNSSRGPYQCRTVRERQDGERNHLAGIWGRNSLTRKLRPFFGITRTRFVAPNGTFCLVADDEPHHAVPPRRRLLHLSDRFSGFLLLSEHESSQIRADPELAGRRACDPPGSGGLLHRREPGPPARCCRRVVTANRLADFPARYQK